MRMNATTHYAIARHGGTLTTRPLQAAIDVADHREVVGGNGV